MDMHASNTKFEARWAVWGFAGLAGLVAARMLLGEHLPSLPMPSSGLDAVAAMLAGALLLNLAIGALLIVIMTASRVMDVFTDAVGTSPLAQDRHNTKPAHPAPHAPGGFLN
jgi:hypothetical protein